MNGQHRNPKNWAPGTGWAIGLPLGFAVGISMGIGMGNIGTGLSLGSGIGVAMALIFEHKYARSERQPGEPHEDKRQTGEPRWMVGAVGFGLVAVLATAVVVYVQRGL